MKIYKVNSEDEYLELMFLFDNRGYLWASGSRATNKPEYWEEHNGDFVVSVENNRIRKGSLSDYLNDLETNKLYHFEDLYYLNEN